MAQQALIRFQQISNFNNGGAPKRCCISIGFLVVQTPIVKPVLDIKKTSNAERTRGSVWKLKPCGGEPWQRERPMATRWKPWAQQLGLETVVYVEVGDVQTVFLVKSFSNMGLLGFVFYRTWELCDRKGHKGWREKMAKGNYIELVDLNVSPITFWAKSESTASPKNSPIRSLFWEQPVQLSHTLDDVKGGSPAQPDPPPNIAHAAAMTRHKHVTWWKTEGL